MDEMIRSLRVAAAELVGGLEWASDGLHSPTTNTRTQVEMTMNGLGAAIARLPEDDAADCLRWIENGAANQRRAQEVR